MTEATEEGCPTTRRSVGHRTVTLRSRRPTTILVTFNKKHVSYAPAVVRFVSGELARRGSRTTIIEAPCVVRTTHAPCTRRRRALSAAKFAFFRSKRDEISFRAARLPEFTKRCPPESPEVLAIRPGLAEAQGELSEAALADSRIQSQTASGSAEVTTDLEDNEAGWVRERVHWELTFARKR